MYADTCAVCLASKQFDTVSLADYRRHYVLY